MRTALLTLGLSLAACRTNKVGQDDDVAVDTGDLSLVDNDGDGFPASEDCDDDDASVSPGATEVCDEVDNDCDGEVDEDVTTTWYVDSDGDTYGDEGAVVEACSQPADAVSVAGDCDDTDDTNYPGASERCDGVDNDCDAEVDEDVRSTWYADSDLDGFGDPEGALDDCDPPDGYVADNTDCDDSTAAAYPGAEEVCDGIDNDCDTDVDEPDATDASTWYADSDGDGFGDPDVSSVACDQPSATVDNAGDCDDSNVDINPSATEICDGADNDCDTDIDDADASLDLTSAQTFYSDADTDGYGDAAAPVQACVQPSGAVSDATDCDDTATAVNPGATEICNTIDDDCDGSIDDDDASLDASTGSTFYADVDTDGYGDAASSTQACVQPGGFVSDATDCDDTATAVNPGATEICNTIDDDCDGSIDDDDASLDASTGSTFYADADTDGYGDASSSTQACTQPSGLVSDATDCDDTAAALNPGATEICNTIDDDCDGSIDDDDSSLDASTGSTFYADADTDGFGDAASSTQACTQPSGFVSDATDCDDSAAAVNPGAAEICNGDDDDCDTDVDEGVLGAGAACPAESCDDVLTDQPTATDDTYWLEGSSGSLFEAWCDMTVDNGGWTLIGSIVNDGTRRWNSTSVFMGTTTFGSIAGSQTADFKSEAWYEVAGWDLLILTDDYDMGFYSVLLGDEMSTWLTSEYDSSACNETWYASGADYYSGLTAAQAAAQGVIVRPRDTNATCFPGSNENALLGFHNATCCWAGGLGNAPNGQATWRQHDLSLVQSSTMSVSTCTAGSYPCNDNGRVLDTSSFCYDTSCKVTWAEVYVR